MLASTVAPDFIAAGDDASAFVTDKEALSLRGKYQPTRALVTFHITLQSLIFISLAFH